MPEKTRLQKYLAQCGVASRRASEAIIAAGRVAINDEVVTQMGTTVDSATDRVTVDGNQHTGSFRSAPNGSASDVTIYGYGDTRTNPSLHDNVTGAMITDIDGDPRHRLDSTGLARSQRV